MSDYPTLPALIASRICHDLISPIGAVDNGLELIAMTTRLSGPEMGLIRQSTNAALTRIELFRLAFGAGGTAPCPIGRLNNTLAAHLAERRINLTVEIDAATMDAAKKISLALLCAETCLPRGGTVTVSASATHGQFHLQAEGPLRNDIDTLWHHVLSPKSAAPPPRAADVHFLLLGLSLAADDITPTLTMQEEGIQLTF